METFINIVGIIFILCGIISFIRWVKGEEYPGAKYKNEYDHNQNTYSQQYDSE